MTITLGQYVVRRRRELGLKQYQLAAALGTTRSYISKIEHDKAKDPRYALIVRLAEALDDDVVRVLRVTGLEDLYRREMPAKSAMSPAAQRVVSAINTRFRFLTDEQAAYALRFFGSLVGEEPPDLETETPDADGRDRRRRDGA